MNQKERSSTQLSERQISDIENIKDLAKKNPHLSKRLVYFYLTQNIPVEHGNNEYYESIKGMLFYIQKYKEPLRTYLDKSPVEYSSFEKLSDDIRVSRDKARVKKEFINELPSRLRKKATVSNFTNKQIGLILEYLDKPRNLFRPPERSKNLDDHLRYIATRLKELSNTDSLEETIRTLCKNNDDIDLIHDKDKVLVVRTPNPAFIKRFGSQRWCIVYSMRTYYKNYVTPNSHTQFLIFNFNKPLSDPLFKVGISLDSRGNIITGACQDNFNKRVNFDILKKDLRIPDNLIITHKYSPDTVKKTNDIYNIVSNGSAKELTPEIFGLIKDVIEFTGEHLTQSLDKDVAFNLLINHGVNVNLKNRDGDAALHVAAKLNNINKIKILLANGANINLKNRDGDAALHIAAKLNNINTIKILLAHGANINLKNRQGNPPLSVACFNGSNEAVKCLIDNGANLYRKNKKHETPLMIAVAANRTGTIGLLMKYDKDLLKRPEHKNIISFAIKQRSTEAVSLLLSLNADTNAKNMYGDTAVMTAVKMRQPDVVKTLIPHCNLNVTNRGNDTPLLYAIKDKNFTLVTLLAENGAELNIQDINGNSALHYACRYNNLELVNYLLTKGADPALKNNIRQTPLYVAMEHDNKRIVRSIIDHIKKTSTQFNKFRIAKPQKTPVRW